MNTDFFVAGGTLTSSTASYIERDVDRTLYEALLDGRYCYVLNSRQIGKSSLCVRTQMRLQEQGVTSAFVDLSRIGSRNLAPEQWYAGLAVEIGRALGLSREILAFWKENGHLSPLQRLFTAFRAVILASVQTPIVVMIDEIDATRSLPFDADEFFAAVRDCRNQQAQDPVYERLTFCLIGAAVPSDLIRDPRITAFNIGERINLSDFTVEEAKEFGKGLGNRAHLVPRIHYWTGGHPYLMQSVCLAVANDASIRSDRDIDLFIERELLRPEARETNVNLADVAKRLLNSPEDGEDLQAYRSAILTTYEGIARKKTGVRDDESNRQAAVLKLSGIVRIEKGFLQVRNPVYARAFGPEWIRENMPGDELRRQKAAYTAGLLRAGFGAAVIVAVLATLSVVAISQRIRADQSSRLAGRRLLEAEQSTAQANSSLAQAMAAEKRAEELAKQRDKAFQSLKATELNEQKAEKQAVVAAKQALAAKNQSLQSLESAKRAEAIARTKSEEAMRNAKASYVANLKVAASAIKGGEVRLARSILRNLRSSPHRDGAYGYLCRMAEDGSFDLRGPLYPTTWVRFTPDSSQVVATAQDGSVTVWRVRDSKLIRSMQVPSANVFCGALSPDGHQVVTGSTDGRVTAFDLTTGIQLWQRNAGSSLDWLCCQSHGDLVAACQISGYISIYRLEDGKLVERFFNAPNQATSACFSPDGSKLSTASSSGKIIVWSVDGPKPLLDIDNGTTVNSVCYSNDGSVIASADYHGQVRTWNANTGKLIWSEAPGGTLNAIVAAPKGGGWLSLSQQGHSILWDQAGNRVRDFGSEGDVASQDVTFSPDGSMVAMTRADISIWPTTPIESTERICDLGNGASDVAVSRDGSRIVVGGSKGQIKLLDGKTYRCLQSVQLPSQQVTVDVSDDGRFVAACSQTSGRALVYKASSMKKLVDVSGSGGIRISPDGKSFFSGNSHGAFHQRDLATGKELRSFEGHSATISRVGFSPDGKRMLTCSEDLSARIWDLASGKCLNVIQPSYGKLLCGTFSPNGRYVVLGDSGGGIWLFDENAKPLHSYYSGPRGVVGLAFSPDSQMIVSTAEDGSVRCWQTETISELFSLGSWPGSVGRCACASDGRIFLCAGQGVLMTRPIQPEETRNILAREENERQFQVRYNNQFQANVTKQIKLRKKTEQWAGVIAQVVAAADDGRYEQAASLCAKLAQAIPEDPQYLSVQALYEFDSGQNEAAIRDANKLAVNYDSRLEAFVLLGFAYFKAGDKTRYTQVCRDAIDQFLTVQTESVMLLLSLDPDVVRADWPVIGDFINTLPRGDYFVRGVWQILSGQNREGVATMGNFLSGINLAATSFAKPSHFYGVSYFLAARAEASLGDSSAAGKYLSDGERLLKRLETRNDPLFAGAQMEYLLEQARAKARAAIGPG